MPILTSVCDKDVSVGWRILWAFHSKRDEGASKLLYQLKSDMPNSAKLLDKPFDQCEFSPSFDKQGDFLGQGNAELFVLAGREEVEVA